MPCVAHNPNPFFSFYLDGIARVYSYGDIPGASVVTWTLWAIFTHQSSSPYV